jgi:hypothetical protein
MEAITVRFTEKGAARAVDVLNEGGQLEVSGPRTYTVTPRHITLLKRARIRFTVVGEKDED